MYRSNMSTLLETGTPREPSRSVPYHRTVPPDMKHDPRYIPVSKAFADANGKYIERLPPLTRTFRSRTSGRAGMPEVIPVSDAAPKTSSKQTTGDGSSAVDPKRASYPQTKKTGKEIFAGLGKKVTSMVRARLAFQANRKIRDDIRDADTMEEIHQMPKAPRFSSFLSPEAQYAMMMGYEDVLHQQLSRNHPEYRSVLKRSKTPMFNVGIGKVNIGQRRFVVTSPDGREQDGGEDGRDADDREKTDIDDEEGRSISRQKTESPKPPKKSKKRRRSKKTQQGIPLDRRLHLTYRLESAMDILDTIRRRHGQPPISPRVRSNSREIAPIRDYNSWTNVWKKEFSKNDDKLIQREVNV